VADAQNDVIPSSLRFDEIHLNNDGSVLVAAKVKEFLDAKGW
jgi:lysophospholipase L1-like esterase